MIDDACAVLQQPGKKLAEAQVPDAAGLYAIYGSGETWAELGMAEPHGLRPLYVGKAERSMVSRDLNTHFKPGRTGQSTLRRTFAALLRDKLGLVGIPRNLKMPERPANFALSAEHDAVLQTWIEDHVTIVVWVKPIDCDRLGEIEIGVITRLKPLLNLKDSEGRSGAVSEARKRMDDDARAWIAAHPPRGDSH